MTTHFEAEAVEIEETEFGVLSVGFYTEENYFMIQKSLDNNDANYYIELSDQSFSGYGGVKFINLSSNQVEVKLDEIGKENLDCDLVIVDFATDNETFELLTEKLKYIFDKQLIIK